MDPLTNYINIRSRLAVLRQKEISSKKPSSQVSYLQAQASSAMQKILKNKRLEVITFSGIFGKILNLERKLYEIIIKLNNSKTQQTKTDLEEKAKNLTESIKKTVKVCYNKYPDYNSHLKDFFTTWYCDSLRILINFSPYFIGKFQYNDLTPHIFTKEELSQSIHEILGYVRTFGKKKSMQEAMQEMMTKFLPNNMFSGMMGSLVQQTTQSNANNNQIKPPSKEKIAEFNNMLSGMMGPMFQQTTQSNTNNNQIKPPSKEEIEEFNKMFSGMGSSVQQTTQSNTNNNQTQLPSKEQVEELNKMFLGMGSMLQQTTQSNITSEIKQIRTLSTFMPIKPIIKAITSQSLKSISIFFPRTLMERMEKSWKLLKNKITTIQLKKIEILLAKKHILSPSFLSEIEGLIDKLSPIIFDIFIKNPKLISDAKIKPVLSCIYNFICAEKIDFEKLTSEFKILNTFKGKLKKTHESITKNERTHTLPFMKHVPFCDLQPDNVVINKSLNQTTTSSSMKEQTKTRQKKAVRY